MTDDVISDIRFDNSGCAISTASAWLMSEAAKGRSRAEVAELFGSVHRMLTRHDATPDAALGKLAARAGVRGFPARVKCVSLRRHRFDTALTGGSTVSTE